MGGMPSSFRPAFGDGGSPANHPLRRIAIAIGHSSWKVRAIEGQQAPRDAPEITLQARRDPAKAMAAAVVTVNAPCGSVVDRDQCVVEFGNPRHERQARPLAQFRRKLNDLHPGS